MAWQSLNSKSFRTTENEFTLTSLRAYAVHPQPAYGQQATYVVPLERLGENPEWVDCPFCRKVTKTRVDKEDSTMTMVAGGLLCLVCICLACLPCMLGWAQNTYHVCTQCGKQLAFRPHDGMLQVHPAAKEAQQAARGGAPAGPPPGTVQSQYAQPQQQQQAEAPRDEGIQQAPQTQANETNVQASEVKS